MPTVSEVLDLLTEPAVVASVLAAAVVVVALAVAGIRAPGLVAWVPAVLLAMLIGSVDAERYGSAVRDYRWWSGPALAVAVAVVLVAAWRVRASGGRAGVALGVYMAAAAVGVFLCVPETQLLRLVPGPVAVVVVAAMIGWLRPAAGAEALLLAALLAWITVVDGQARSTAIAGAAVCLASAWMLPLVVRRGAGQGAAEPGTANWLARLGVLAAAVLACSRLAAMLDWLPLAVAAMALVQVAAAVALRRLAAPAHRPAASPA